MACRTAGRPPARWDSDGDLHQVDSTSVTYDAMGRVMDFTAGSSTTEIVYGPAGGKLALANVPAGGHDTLFVSWRFLGGIIPSCRMFTVREHRSGFSSSR